MTENYFCIVVDMEAEDTPPEEAYAMLERIRDCGERFGPRPALRQRAGGGIIAVAFVFETPEQKMLTISALKAGAVPGIGSFQRATVEQ